ncbi:AAA family ATPase [Gryllotalpicola koreensis]|uniref:Polynucleotide kinase PNKP phosphatase domain-containing protein n=1 Tax=Gryllotalpicola koreensis TaxID=993086 RepID=A0ABP8A1V9_9MICO
MPKIILTRGLPASGKTEWAKSWVSKDPEHRVNVNRDDLRKALFNAGKAPLSYAQEQVITKAQQGIVKGALEKGLDVVVSDNNLAAKYIKQWYQFGEVEFQDFEVPLDELIKRDFDRHDPVGEQVIRDRWQRFTRNGKLPVPPPKAEVDVDGDLYSPDVTKPKAYIFDIDGTLAMINPDNPRSPYDRERVSEDHVVTAVRRVLWQLEKTATILITSGRDEICRPATEEWLDNHHIPYTQLFMRAEGDTRKDHVVKLELFNKHIRHNYNVQGVFDDRLRVVRMWHRIGVPLFRVGDPDADF